MCTMPDIRYNVGLAVIPSEPTASGVIPSEPKASRGIETVPVEGLRQYAPLEIPRLRACGAPLGMTTPGSLRRSARNDDFAHSRLRQDDDLR